MVPGTNDDDAVAQPEVPGLGRQSMHSVAAAVGAAVLGNDGPARPSGHEAADAPDPADDDHGAGAPGAALALTPLAAMLPDLVHRAERTRERFTLVLARPGDAVAPGDPVPPARPAELAELGPAIHSSLEPGQQLYTSGDRHLAVLLDGTSRRRTTALMESAAAAGAPTFTWVACHYPEDARSAACLVNLAEHHLDGVPLVAEEEIGGAMWWRSRGFLAAVIGSAAALLLGLLFTAGGGTHSTAAKSGQINSGLLRTTGGSDSTQGAPGSNLGVPTTIPGHANPNPHPGPNPNAGPTPGPNPHPNPGPSPSPSPNPTVPTTTTVSTTTTVGRSATRVAAQNTTKGSLLSNGILLTSVTMTATLSSTATGAGVANETLTFTANSNYGTCTAKTNASGVASCTVSQLITVPAPTSYAVSFAGDSGYSASSGSATVH